MPAQALQTAWYSGARWLWLLRPLEVIFRCLASLRRALYRSGILPVYRADKPVVVVGNITVGGTGKTPVVIALVEALAAAGFKAGVVSRGYGAGKSPFPHRVSEHSSAQDCGDEPLLIHRRTGCPCVVDPDRPRAVRELLQWQAVDIVISDDGMQHYALGRDMEIALVDAARGLGNGFCLPAGPLRESRGRLDSVDVVLYRDGHDSATAFSYRLQSLVNLASGEERPLAPGSLAGTVCAVAGIGQPQQFFDGLSAAGFEFESIVFDDHHAYRAEDFARLRDRAIIMTEKDAVKCAGMAGSNAWYVRMDAALPAPVVDAVASLARA